MDPEAKEKRKKDMGNNYNGLILNFQREETLKKIKFKNLIKKRRKEWLERVKIRKFKIFNIGKKYWEKLT